MKSLLGRIALVAVVLVGLPWAASALGEAIAGPTPDTTTVPAVGDDTGTVVVTSSPSPAALVTPRTHTAKASRSRLLGRPAIGSLQDVTCYASGTITASGKTPRIGMVATLDRSIPFGTLLHIDNLGTFVVEDRVGHSSDVDVYGPSESYCREFGRRHLAVSVVR